MKSVSLSVSVHLLRAIELILWFLLGGRSYNKKSKENIFVLRTAKLGDFICGLPALHELADLVDAPVRLLTGFSKKNTQWTNDFECPWTSFIDPEAKLDVIAANLDEVKELRTQIKAKGWSQFTNSVIVLAASGESPISYWKKLIFLRLIGINGCICGSSVVYRNWLIRRFQGDQTHQSKHALQIISSAANQIGIRRQKHSTEKFQLHIDPTLKEWSENVWKTAAPEQELRVVVAPGGARLHKRWPIQQYNALCGDETLASTTVIFVGDERDRILISDELSVKRPHLNLAGRLTLQQSAALIGRADLFIGNDSGPAHLAAASGVATIVLFSGIHPPGLWEPTGQDVTVVRHLTPCIGCRSEIKCPIGTNECINKIDVTLVKMRVTEVLRKKRIIKPDGSRK